MKIKKSDIKIIVFKCGCKLMWKKGTERKHKVCPDHKRPVKAYVLWCEMCQIKITAIPRAGYRQKRCAGCSKSHEITRCRDAWRKGIYKNSDYGIPRNIPRELKESEGSKQRRFIDEIFYKLSKKYLPEGITSTPF